MVNESHCILSMNVIIFIHWMDGNKIKWIPRRSPSPLCLSLAPRALEVSVRSWPCRLYNPQVLTSCFIVNYIGQLVWEAGRSSGAAPSYFPAHGSFIDGGIMSNNPTTEVLAAIQQYNTSVPKNQVYLRALFIHIVIYNILYVYLSCPLQLFFSKHISGLHTAFWPRDALLSETAWH